MERPDQTTLADLARVQQGLDAALVGLDALPLDDLVAVGQVLHRLHERAKSGLIKVKDAIRSDAAQQRAANGTREARHYVTPDGGRCSVSFADPVATVRKDLAPAALRRLPRDFPDLFEFDGRVKVRPGFAACVRKLPSGVRTRALALVDLDTPPARVTFDPSTDGRTED